VRVVLVPWAQTVEELFVRQGEDPAVPLGRRATLYRSRTELGQLGLELFNPTDQLPQIQILPDEDRIQLPVLEILRGPVAFY